MNILDFEVKCQEMTPDIIKKGALGILKVVVSNISDSQPFRRMQTGQQFVVEDHLVVFRLLS